MLLLATARPEYRPEWSARVERISLPPLTAGDASILLDDWLGPDPALAALRARIEARAGGNPLFVEEIVRSLVERGALRGERGAYAPAAPDEEEVALPETVQAVLASRIDRLSPRDKDVLQAAAVIGREVPAELLRAVVDLPEPELTASLERLATAELLGPPGLRETKLSGIPSRTRWPTAPSSGTAGTGRTPVWRGRCSRSTERRPRGTPRSLPITGRRRASASRPRAGTSRRAGASRAATRRRARGTAGASRGCSPAFRSPRRPCCSRSRRASRCSRSAASPASRRARPRTSSSGPAPSPRDSAIAAVTLSCSPPTGACAGSPETWRSISRVRSRRQPWPRDPADAALAFEMHAVLAHAQLAAGRLDRARATAARALADLARDAGLRQALGRSTAPALCRIWWALASAYLGNADEAQASLEDLLASETEDGLHALYGTHGFLCEVLRVRGDLPGALAQGRRAVELAEERGSPFSQVEAAAFLGAAALAAGDIATAASTLETALGLARTRRTALWYEPRLLATLAEASASPATAHAPALSWTKRARSWREGRAGGSAPATSS